MISDTDLPQQLDSHQQPSVIEKRIDKRSWKYFFIVLLAFNVISISYGLNEANSGALFAGPAFAAHIAFILIINFFAGSFYFFKKHPHNHRGTYRVIRDLVLILAIFALIIAGIIIYTVFGLMFNVHP